MKQVMYDKIREDYKKEIDRAIVNKFGDCKFNTSWNIISGGYITTYDSRLPSKKKEEIKGYIQGFSDGYVRAMEKTLKVK